MEPGTCRGMGAFRMAFLTRRLQSYLLSSRSPFVGEIEVLDVTVRANQTRPLQKKFENNSCMLHPC